MKSSPVSPSKCLGSVKVLMIQQYRLMTVPGTPTPLSIMHWMADPDESMYEYEETRMVPTSKIATVS